MEGRRRGTTLGAMKVRGVGEKTEGEGGGLQKSSLKVGVGMLGHCKRRESEGQGTRRSADEGGKREKASQLGAGREKGKLNVPVPCWRPRHSQKLDCAAGKMVGRE